MAYSRDNSIVSNNNDATVLYLYYFHATSVSITDNGDNKLINEKWQWSNSAKAVLVAELLWLFKQAPTVFIFIDAAKRIY